ncbi:hypothetical protein [Nocardia jejuensis]|uniref:hypothetical protein n=1 Tax=Nocardia jejuensis TaxID=328049 RepID=UPI00082D4A07|nr:hypothetical protein [Nocardia jejuensis]
MTSANPGSGGQQDPEQHQETAQWWATAPTGGEPSAPLTGTDPTMMNYGAATTPPYQPPAQPIPPAPQQYSAPQQQYSAPQQQYSAPQQQYSGPQPQYSAPQQQQFSAPQPQFAPQQQFATPPPNGGGYGYPTPPPPGGGGSKTGWIVGGAIGLVVLVGIGIGVLALTGKDKSVNPFGDDKKNSADGKYSMSGITNACSIVDPTVLTKWATNSKGTPEHSETQPTDYSGGRMDCKAGYEKQSPTDKYTTDTADLTLDVDFLSGSSSAYNRPSYDTWKQFDTGTTGSGRASGDVAGLGTEAYWASQTDNYTYWTTIDYTVAAKDDNASVKVNLRIRLGQGENLSKDEVAQVAKQQAQQALDGLKKK